MADKRVNIVIRAKDTAGKALDKVKSRLLSIKSILGAGIGLVALNRGLRETVGRAASAETGLKRLAVAMKAAGRFTTENAQHFADMAVELERTTGFVEEDVLQALAVLQTFGQMTRDDMDKTIKATLNMATVFNEDLTQAAIRLGKAYNGQLIGLQRMGVAIDKATFNAKGFQAVLDQLAIEQGGQAVARMKGFEGGINAIKAGYGELGKEVGKFITQNKTLRGFMSDLSGGFYKLAKFTNSLRESEGALTGQARKLNEELKAQKKAMEEAGQAVENNILVQYKQELIALTNEVEKGTEKIKLRVATEQVRMTVEQAYAVQLARIAKLETAIADLESDRNVQGSKANAQERERLKLLKERADEEKRIIKIGENAFDNLKRQGEGIQLLIDRTKELTEKRKDAAEDQKAAQRAVQEFVSESLQILADLQKQAADEEEALEQEKLDAATSNLQKRAAITKQFLDEETNAIIDNAKRQLSILDDLLNDRKRRETETLREVLQGDQLNVTERKILLEEYGEKVDEINEKLSQARTPEDIKNLTDQLKQISDIFSGISDTETLNEALTQAQQTADIMVQKFSEMNWEEIFDISKANDSLIRQSRDAARLIRETIQRDLDSNPIEIPVKFNRDSYTRGG